MLFTAESILQLLLDTAIGLHTEHEMTLPQQLAVVIETYRNAPNPNQTISRTNYLAMLSAFRTLVPLADISDSLDTELRRNLPGGGLSGLQVVPLHQRIDDAATYASSKPLYPGAGAAIAENILVILELLKPSELHDQVAESLRGNINAILAGQL